MLKGGTSDIVILKEGRKSMEGMKAMEGRKRKAGPVNNRTRKCPWQKLEKLLPISCGTNS
jgi:hypothetical protein